MGFQKFTRAESYESVESDEKIASLDELEERREALRELTRIGQEIENQKADSKPPS